jgi:fatty acid desaturase
MNSLSVTNNPVMEFVTLNFGYHTEHHLFPSMPMSNAKKVSEKLKRMYPERYKIMPKHKAMGLLYSTPRLYKNRDTLVNPKTNEEFRTLGR